MTDSFETKFSILADAQINEKIPAMKKHMIGFQVVASEENNSKAIGVLAYNIGKRLVYVPIFWLNGRVKGGDMMYLKNEDRFLPLGEIWVNFVNSGRTFSIGESDRSTDDQKGAASRVSTLDLSWLYSKRAGEVSLINPEDVVRMSALTECPPVSLAKHLSVFSKEAAEALAKTITSSPDFANALFRHYTPQELFDIIGGRLKTASENNSRPQAVTFYTDKYSKAASELSLQEKQELISDGIVARDNRTETSQLFSVRKGNTKYSSPDVSGKYEVLTASYDLVPRTIVLLPKDTTCQCFSCRNRFAKPGRQGLIIDADTKTFVKRDVSDVMAIKVEAKSADNNPANVALGVPVTVDALRECAINILERPINSYGVGSVVFYSPTDREGISGDILISASGSLLFRVAGCDGKDRKIILTETNGKMGLLTNSSIFLPSNTKMIKLDSYKNDYDSAESYTVGFGLTAPFSPAAVGLNSIKVASDGIRYSISSERSSEPSLNYIDAVKRLVAVEGVSSKQAKELLLDAKSLASNTNRLHTIECIIKYAADIMDSEEGYGNDHTITKEVFSTPGLSNRDIAAITEASKKGVKEVLDTKVLAELAKSSYPIDRTTNFLPSFMNSIDKLCRLLFMFYWHNEAFSDRYGKQNLEQIEESLKDNLQSLGDLVIYLKEKSVTSDDALGFDQENDLSKDLL